jgi:RNA polymerase sigma-70 factor (ECF subfamily)
MAQPADEQVVAAVLAGDADAANEFWMEISARLQRFALREGLTPADALDVVQESLQHAIRDMRSGKFRAEGPLAGWIHGIYWHKLADFIRGAKRSRERLTALSAPSPDDEPAETAMACRGPNPEQVASVKSALDQLPARERAALILSEQFGLAAWEFAPYLGVPARKASKILTRARHHVAEINSTSVKMPGLKRLKR